MNKFDFFEFSSLLAGKLGSRNDAMEEKKPSCHLIVLKNWCPFGTLTITGEIFFEKRGRQIKPLRLVLPYPSKLNKCDCLNF